MSRAVPAWRVALWIGAVVLISLIGAAPDAAGASWHLGVRAGAFEPQQAADTYDALYGDTMVLFGARAEVRFDRGWFVAFSADRGDVDGELVARAPGGGFVPTGEPTDLTMMPIHLTVGGIVRPDRPWSFYYGGGPSVLLWEEDNSVAPQDESDNGLHVLAGVRRAFGRADASVEAIWSTIPDALGEGGLSQRLGEDDWGGLALHAVVAFRIGR